MPTCHADKSIKRLAIGEFQFPLGVYPVEAASPQAGYVTEFEPADGGDEADEGEGGWEEWPDRYVYDIVISAERLEPLCRRLFSLLPGRVFPILDVLGRDAHREIDPYISYQLLGLDRFVDAVRQYRDFFYEDGMCGFGAMSESPFVYLFIDEHKIATVRVEPAMKDRVEKLLAAFDLEPAERGREPAGADSAAHEHRTVLIVPEDAPNVLGADEIVERLRDDWKLALNIDPETNVDEEGEALGVTPWRCLVRVQGPRRARGTTPRRYAEILLHADCLRQAEETAFDATEAMLGEDDEEEFEDAQVVGADRMEPKAFAKLAGEIGGAKGRRGSAKSTPPAGTPDQNPKRGKGRGRAKEAPGEEPAASGTVVASRWLA